MATEIDAAFDTASRLMRYRRRVNKESSMAKLYASEVAVRVANRRCKSTAATVHRLSCRSFIATLLCTIGEGTSEIQRLVIARQLLKS
jgi:alkylation response protein AidB-like acyl-CoA dehydrogenase